MLAAESEKKVEVKIELKLKLICIVLTFYPKYEQHKSKVTTDLIICYFSSLVYKNNDCISCDLIRKKLIIKQKYKTKRKCSLYKCMGSYGDATTSTLLIDNKDEGKGGRRK